MLKLGTDKKHNSATNLKRKFYENVEQNSSSLNLCNTTQPLALQSLQKFIFSTFCPEDKLKSCTGNICVLQKSERKKYNKRYPYMVFVFSWHSKVDATVVFSRLWPSCGPNYFRKRKKYIYFTSIQYSRCQAIFSVQVNTRFLTS